VLVMSSAPGSDKSHRRGNKIRPQAKVTDDKAT